jgi:sarcosine oxidase
MTKSSHYDVIVVGLGAMGSASLYHTARSSKRVLGLDQFVPPHPFGSSHGETRITRLAIGEGIAYTPFAIRSHELWREYEKEFNEQMLFQVGGLILGNRQTTGRFHNKVDFLGTTIEAAQRHGIRHEMLSSSEIRARFPQFNVENEESGYYEYEAGYLNPEVCIRAQLSLAQKYGASLQYGERVSSIKETPHGGVEVITNAGRYTAEQIIVTAGPWLQKLLPERFSEFRVTRQVLHWFSIGERYDLFTPDRCPIFIWSFSDTEGGIYGFPAIDGAGGGVKVASETYAESVDPDNVSREVSPLELERFFDTHISRHMPHLAKPCIRHTTCLYTVTPNSDFAIGRLPHMPQCLVVSACSGHGFKHSAALGEAVAQLVTTGTSKLTIAPFALSPDTDRNSAKHLKQLD